MVRSDGDEGRREGIFCEREEAFYCRSPIRTVAHLEIRHALRQAKRNSHKHIHTKKSRNSVLELRSFSEAYYEQNIQADHPWKVQE
jgi:hypothetical protein